MYLLRTLYFMKEGKNAPKSRGLPQITPVSRGRAGTEIRFSVPHLLDRP